MDNNIDKLIWIEAQDFYDGTVDVERIAPLPEASQGKILTAIQLKNHWLSYSFIIHEDGWFSYDLWMRYATICPSTEFNFYINNKPVSIEFPVPPTETYFAPLEWVKINRVDLPKGQHELKVEFVSGVLHPDVFVLVRDSSFITDGKADAKINGETTSLEEDLSEFTKDRLWIEETPRSGVPLGGIGTGKVEIARDGVFTNITINNNQEAPIYNAPGCFFAFREKTEDGITAKILQKSSPYDLPRTSRIEYRGEFPITKVTYEDPEISSILNLEAFSPVIPHDTENSNIPGIIFSFKISNPTAKTVSASLLFSWENLLNCGGWAKQPNPAGEDNIKQVYQFPYFVWNNRTGNKQSLLSENGLTGLTFSSSEDHDNKISSGDYTLACDCRDADVTVLPSWNVEEKPDRLWRDFKNSGKLMEKDEPKPTGSEGIHHPAGAVCAGVNIEPKSEKQLTFVLSWYLPRLIDWNGLNWGNAYAKRFSGSSQVAHYLIDNKDQFAAQTRELPRVIHDSSLPEWLKTKLMDDMFPMISCSWYTADGKFSVNEAPTMMHGCLGTMDQRLSSHSIYTLFYPDLDEIELDLFRQWQHEDGLVTHDLGHGVFCKKDSVAAVWPDIASSFALQVYKHYLYTGNEVFFKTFYPHLKKAVEWQKKLDEDGDGIAELKPGRGTTYDSYYWYGASTFVASLWLATLRVAQRAAELMNDQVFAQECADLYEKVGESMIDSLWTGSYFRNYREITGQKRICDNCFVGQLAGQWFMHLIDEGYQVPEEMVKKSIASMKKMNVELPGHLAISDETTPDGKLEWSAVSFIQYAETYYACLAIYNDMVDEGLQCLKKIHNVCYNINQHPWKTYLTYFAKNGKPTGLPWYMTNTASWFALNALTGFHYDAVRGSITIAPHLATGEKHMKLPLFSPLFWSWLDYEKNENGEIFNIIPIKRTGYNHPPDFRFFITYVSSENIINQIYCNGEILTDYVFDNTTGKLILSFKLNIEEKQCIQIRANCKSLNDRAASHYER